MTGLKEVLRGDDDTLPVLLVLHLEYFIFQIKE
jgi:hypothetical protein